MPRLTSKDPFMTATPFVAHSSTQPSTLLPPLTSATTPAPTPRTLEMNSGGYISATDDEDDLTLQTNLLDERVNDRNDAQTNENKSMEFDDVFGEKKDVETNACAIATISMESKENNTLCVLHSMYVCEC
jgi:hypothetical protein